MPKKLLSDKLVKELLNDPYNYAKSITITKLVNILKKLSKGYYQQQTLVPDSVYDLLRTVLLERSPTNKFLKEVGAPISKDKVSLPFPMASLDKIKPSTDTLDNWKKEYPGPYIISDKLDGVSALIYKEDEVIKMYTRGDTYNGQNITHLLNYVVESLDKVPDNTAIRGELLISKINFEQISDRMKNARNAVAGLVNAKNYSEEVAEITDFVAYAIVSPLYKQNDQMKLMKKWD